MFCIVCGPVGSDVGRRCCGIDQDGPRPSTPPTPVCAPVRGAQLDTAHGSAGRRSIADQRGGLYWHRGLHAKRGQVGLTP
jgi:hypothetical protein